MLKGSLWKIALLISTFSLIEGNFDIKVTYCRFKCEDPCNTQKETYKPRDNAKRIGGYYWRDFYGVIPIDAYPLGNPNQNPQTYIGMAYDPSKNGTFVVTIVDGLDYVYTAFGGVVTKKTKHIQIFCTMERERMSWKHLTGKNYGSVSENYEPVVGHSHRVNEVTSEGLTKTDIVAHYITKVSNYNVSYAGQLYYYSDPVEYALINGTYQKSETALWLLYRPKKAGEADEDTKNAVEPSINNYVRPGSMIPKFYRQINIGWCTIICSNIDARIMSSMAYYWKPNKIYKYGKDGLPVGREHDTILYSAQGIPKNNWYDVGQTDIFSVQYADGWKSFLRYHILSSNHPEHFEWVKTTTGNFKELDQSRMIPGGETDDGIEIFVGRRFSTPSIIHPGSVRLFKYGAVFYSQQGSYKDFEVIMYKG